MVGTARSNLRPTVLQTVALPGCATPRLSVCYFFSWVGSRGCRKYFVSLHSCCQIIVGIWKIILKSTLRSCGLPSLTFVQSGNWIPQILEWIFAMSQALFAGHFPKFPMSGCLIRPFTLNTINRARPPLISIHFTVLPPTLGWDHEAVHSWISSSYRHQKTAYPKEWACFSSKKRPEIHQEYKHIPCLG